MRKLIIEEWISLDGYVSDKNGKLDFFIRAVRETYTDDLQQKFLETIDCILLEEDLADEFRLHLCPVWTAGGRKFFPEEIDSTTLKLSQIKLYDNGNIFLNYHP